MKDLDFDELDRAVNSMIAGGSTGVVGGAGFTTGNPEVKKAEPDMAYAPTPIDSHFSNAVVPVDISDAKTIGTVSSLPTPTITPKSELELLPGEKPATIVKTPLQTQAVSLLAKRRNTGRFMDVVRPSSDMRTNISAPEHISRQGNTISPVSTNLNTVQPKPILSPNLGARINPTLKAESFNTEQIKSKWSDVLDTDGKATVRHEVANEDDDSDIDRINDDITNTLNQIPEVQVSPFLSNAKVEKRPLGGAVQELQTNGPDNSSTKLALMDDDISPDSMSVADTVSDGADGRIDADAPLPPELQSDLLSIESAAEVAEDQPLVSSASVTPSLRSEPTPRPSFTPLSTARPVTRPVVMSSQNSTIAAAPVISATNASSSSVTVPTPNLTSDGPTSISQQYQESPSTGDQRSGAIYDTDAYHKVVIKPVKKAKSWMWVVWILLLLLVGSGVGAAIYFFVLPIL